MTRQPFQRIAIFVTAAAGIMALELTGCKDSIVDGPSSQQAAGARVTPSVTGALSKTTGASETNLVSDLTTVGAKHIDPNLLNAWGIAVTPNQKIWISANHSSLAVSYDKGGNSAQAAISIPTVGGANGGAPSGDVFNPTSGFAIPGTNMPARLIFAGEDGIISAWNSGSSAMVVVDHSSTNAVYKGIEIASNSGTLYLYATNFKGSTVEVFDGDFKFVTDQWFKDPGIPSDYGPFNIRLIDGKLFVTFAKHKAPDNMDDQAGVGFGYVDVFTTGGTLISRFASQGTLNSPWGLAKAEQADGMHQAEILIGNFGDGRINAYDAQGNFLGQLKDKQGSEVMIDGLWALTFIQGRSTEGSSSKLFFTAGPNEENDGVFGYLNVQ